MRLIAVVFAGRIRHAPVRIRRVNNFPAVEVLVPLPAHSRWYRPVAGALWNPLAAGGATVVVPLYNLNTRLTFTHINISLFNVYENSLGQACFYLLA